MLTMPRSTPRNSVAGVVVPSGIVHRDEKEPLAVLAENEVALALGEAEPLDLVLADDERHDHATFERQQAHPVEPLERQDPVVEGDRGVLAKRGTLVLVPLERFNDLAMHRMAI